MVDMLEENAALSKPKSLQIECELSGVKDELINPRKDLETQRFAFEQQLQVETRRL